MLSILLFSACGAKQVSILQIQDALTQAQASDYDEVEATKARLYYNSYGIQLLLDWQVFLERQNCSSENLVMLDRYYVYLTIGGSEKQFTLSILKFENSKDVSNCLKKLDFSIEKPEFNDIKVKTKQYGNLLVITDEQIADSVFKIIDKI